MTDDEAERIAREFYRDMCRWVRRDVPNSPAWEELTRRERAALANLLMTRILPPMAGTLARLTEARKEHK